MPQQYKHCSSKLYLYHNSLFSERFYLISIFCTYLFPTKMMFITDCSWILSTWSIFSFFEVRVIYGWWWCLVYNYVCEFLQKRCVRLKNSGLPRDPPRSSNSNFFVHLFICCTAIHLVHKEIFFFEQYWE